MNTNTDKLVNYYELLGIDSKAGPERIKQAYRSRLKEWHPDRNADRIKEAEEFTKILNDAYHILSDPERRKQYDRLLRYTQGKDYNKILNEKEFWEKVEKASPALKKTMKNLKDLFTLFRDSIKGKYDLHPVTLGIIGGGLLYFIIPMDLIPDYLPVVGYLDDLAVLTTIVNSLHEEIEKYRNWKNMN
jgi:uncharacterized membrane protein YkvA (DUF1232 family)